MIFVFQFDGKVFRHDEKAQFRLDHFVDFLHGLAVGDEGLAVMGALIHVQVSAHGVLVVTHVAGFPVSLAFVERP